MVLRNYLIEIPIRHIKNTYTHTTADIIKVTLSECQRPPPGEMSPRTYGTRVRCPPGNVVLG